MLSRAGLSSRRKTEDIIRSGRVSVDGKVVYEKGYRVDPALNKVTVDGRPLKYPEKKYYLINKPRGFVSTVSDPHAEKRVLDLIPGKTTRLYPVGRLDKNSTGLMILTNDGDFAHHLTHPRFEVEKVYEARAKGRVSDKDIARLKNGVELEDGITAPCRAYFLTRDDRETLIKMTLREGKKRQIRKMFDAIGHPVIGLKRISFAGIELGNLRKGRFRMLREDELKRLKEKTYESRKG